MKYFFDTEFIDDGKTIELLSIGIVSEDGREYYADSAETDHTHASAWVQANVLPYLSGPAKPHNTIAADILAFVGTDLEPRFWAYFGAYDWVVFAQLFGRMMNLPKHFPMFCMDLKQLCEHKGVKAPPDQTSLRHNALNDARWTKEAYELVSTLPYIGN